MQQRRGEFWAKFQIPQILRLRRALGGYFNEFTRYAILGSRGTPELFDGAPYAKISRGTVKLWWAASRARYRKRFDEKVQILIKFVGKPLLTFDIGHPQNGLTILFPHLHSPCWCLKSRPKHGFQNLIRTCSYLLRFWKACEITQIRIENHQKNKREGQKHTKCRVSSVKHPETGPKTGLRARSD